MSDLETLYQELCAIRAELASDKYESGGIWTVGGPSGSYTLRSPFNTECEWTVYDVNSTPNGAALVGEATRTVLNVASGALATYTSADLSVGDLTELACMFNVTALTGGTAPTVTFQINTKGSDGIYYQIDKAGAVSSPTPIYRALGSGNNVPMGASDPGSPFGDTIQVVMITTGAPTSITFSASIKGKGPVISAPGNGVVAISPSDPTTVPVNPTLGSSTEDSNAYNGILIPITFDQSHDLASIWQPLGRGANLYITISPVSGLAYVNIAFRRKMKRVIPDVPRVKPHTHVVPSRRSIRTQPAQSPMMAGFGEQMPVESQYYEHQRIPETQDTANIGYVANAPYATQNVPPAQSPYGGSRYRAYRRGQR